MTSSGPYSQSLNFSHMYNVRDLRSSSKHKNITINQDSIMSIIINNPDFTKIKYMMELSGLETVYNDLQSNFTLFIPSDTAILSLGENIFLNMDRNTAKAIIQSCTIKGKIPYKILTDSKATYFYTLCSPNRLYINTFKDQTYINDNIKIIQTDIIASNGIIHVIVKLVNPIII